jgi:predicted CXXCH cytochrome family protein
MPVKKHVLLAALAVALAAAASGRLKPLKSEDAVSTHGPYEMGECEICHQRNDRGNPGPVQKAGADLCLDCHDDLTGLKKSHPSRGNCVACHSPHNARKPKLLL